MKNPSRIFPIVNEKNRPSVFTPQKPELLPKQICHATADGFTSWLRERAVDLNSEELLTLIG